MFTTRIQPRVSETDGLGHINHTTIPVWFEAARKEIFKIVTPDLSFENWHAVVVNINVDYLHETYFGEEVTIHTWVEKIGNRSFVIGEELYQSNKLCAKGTATYVYFNPSTRKAETIPKPIREQLENHLQNSAKK